MLLETIGSQSNIIRKVPLTYTKIDNGYLVAASYGGRDNSPSWFYNIIKNDGFVTVESKDIKFVQKLFKIMKQNIFGVN